MVTQNNYFDVIDVFVNELVGDIWLAVFVGMIIILLVSARTRIPYQVSMIYLVIWFGIMYASSLSLGVLWVLLILFIGLIFYFIMSKLFK